MVSGNGGAWTPSKEIVEVVEAAILHKQADIYAELEEVLTKYKPLFLNLLKNQGRNATHLQELKKASKDGIKLSNHPGKVIRLSEKTIQNIVLFSEANELNELTCLESFLSADAQLYNFPGFSQQFVVSLLYHDGRRCVLSSLKLLLTARAGITWTLDLDDRITELVQKYTDQLMEDDLVSKIIQLLQNVSVPDELSKLEKAHAISDGKHKKIITELIEEQQLLLADCLFALASQYPFSKENCKHVINYLKLIAPNTSDGSLDSVTIRVLLALLASFNCDIMDGAINNIEDEQYLELPYFKDSTYFTSLHQDIIRPDTQVWQTPSLKYVIQLCWAIFLRTCGAHPELADSQADILEEDEGVMDVALDSGALAFLIKTVIKYETFHKEEYFVKLIHSFVTSFIIKFPMKIKELRNRGDENARIIQAHQTEGVEPPIGLKHDFQDLMAVIHSLYKIDPLGLDLCTSYWLPLEPLGDVFAPHPLKKQAQAMDQKKIMLNKFVRLAGDILLQPLYVPYINMLTSLSSCESAALFCFRLLASDGNVSHINSCAVTWDHFFSSIKQYYLSLRQSLDITDNRSHMHRHQEISPEELEGLEATLRLINTLAKYNENVRVAFCENQSWLPIASLLGLISCAVPPSLKGLLMETLASFAKSTEIASSLWVSLEASQILQTNQTAAVKKSGIAVELAEIEARNETFPETSGFLELINTLTDVTIPETLGAGHRIPGFEPYFHFLVNDVFLKFRTRAYQNPDEKWKVGTAVLKILVKIIKNYDPIPSHFQNQKVEIQGVNFGKAAKPSGFQLLVMLLNDTPVLRTALSVISEGEEILKSLITTSGRKEVLENIIELCLDLLNITLDKQSLFMNMASEHCPSLLVSPLDELLLSVNPRTAAPDYLFVLGRYLTINNIRSSVISAVIKIFKFACKYSQMQQQIVYILTKDEIAARELLVGFSEKLEIPDAEIENQQESDELDLTQEQSVYDSIRQDVVRLLMSATQQPTPNFAQFMIGFDVKQPLSATTLQDPGVGTFPKTCLHSVIEVLNRGLNETDKRLTGLTPKLTEDLYHLIFMLSSHPEIGPAVRRYLRTNTDFIQNHCRLLPFVIEETETLDEVLYIKKANQQAWFLKTIAVELKVLAAKSMRSSLLQLISLLFNDQTAPYANNNNVTSLHKTNIDSSVFGDTLSQTAFAVPFVASQSRNTLLTILSSLSFKQRYPPNVEFNYFDYTAVEQLINSCEEVTETGVTLCNISKLYKVVMNEINISQISSGVVQRQEILKEMKSLLKHAVDRNLVRESFYAKQNAIDAWRQVVEVLFAVCPVDILPLDVKYITIIDILTELNQKINDSDNLTELTSPVCGIILNLMANLWFTVQQNEKGQGRATKETSLNMGSLVSLFPGIIDCILNMSSSPARMRSSLYGALLYYLQIGNSQDEENVSGEGVTNNIFRKQSQENWKNSTYETILKYGDSLFDIITKDTVQGPCITRMMALSLCDAIITFDWKDKLMILLTSRGYLRVLIDRLIDDDVELQNVLSPQPQSMKPLYLFQSKMALFSKMASREYGCQMLQQNGLISRLAECQFLDFHVNNATAIYQSSMTPSHVNDPFIPSLDERYAKLFSPVAKLILAFLTRAGFNHQAIIAQVQNFVLMHEDLFLNILQDKHEAHSAGSLEQLSLAISIISLLPSPSITDEPYDVLSEERRHWRSFMSRIEVLMPVLLRRYSSESSKKYLKELLSENHDETNAMFVLSPINVQTSEMKNLLFQIRSRILTFFKNHMSSQGTSGASTRSIFSPTFTEYYAQDGKLSKIKKSIHAKASLSILIEELKHGPDNLKTCLEQKKQIERKMENISEWSHEELQEVLAQESEVDRLPYRQRIIVANRILSKLLDLKNTEANLISYNVEQALYLLWRHIDYYYIHCIPTEDSYSYETDYTRPIRARKLTGSSYTSVLEQSSVHDTTNNKSLAQKSGVTRADLQEFKQQASATLNDQFWKKIMDADHFRSQSRTRLSFLSALVHRVQSIVKLNS